MASLIWVTSNLRAILALHPPLQFVDGSCLRPTDDCQVDGIVCFAAEALHLEVAVAGIQGVT